MSTSTSSSKILVSVTLGPFSTPRSL
jgi:hypothetical protein